MTMLMVLSDFMTMNFKEDKKRGKAAIAEGQQSSRHDS